MASQRSTFAPHQRLVIRGVAFCIAAHGLFILAGGLASEIVIHHRFHLSGLAVGLPGLFGITLIYLSTLLRRYKRTAWGVTMLVYGFLLGVNVAEIILRPHVEVLGAYTIVRQIVLPLVIVAGLLLTRNEFTAKSDIRTFHAAVRFAIAVLAITFVYGTVGFVLMDMHDFHEEISVPEAMHRTIDQFDLTTSHPLAPYTERAKLFLDSLSVVSTASVAYALFSFFQPLKVRYSEHHAHLKTLARTMLESQGGSSEDFFKLWPEDKTYFFNKAQTTGLAYKVRRGVALCVGDPMGERRYAKRTITNFIELCFTNDWQPAFIHTEPSWNDTYQSLGFTTQKIGEEAVVDVTHFASSTRSNKYFRNISNRFAKQGYTSEVLLPPHSQAVLRRLREISDDWLSLPGRTERGFVMGYFSDEYMQKCAIVVARDEAGTIRAFLNQIPSFDKEEANFDLLRYARNSPGNINDFVLITFLQYAAEQGFKRVNLGLCPLAKIGSSEKAERSVVDKLLAFVYANGDRFYSFSGLERFKAKYEPTWHSRYVAYRGGVSGFTRTMNALMRAMNVK